MSRFEISIRHIWMIINLIANLAAYAVLDPSPVSSPSF